MNDLALFDERSPPRQNSDHGTLWYTHGTQRLSENGDWLPDVVDTGVCWHKM
jgi:hypothetical protein